MTLEELEYYRSTMQRIKKAEALRRNLLDAAYPGGTGADGGKNSVSDKTGKLGSELADLDTAINEMYKQINAQLADVEILLARCGDVWKRQIIRMRFCRALEWQEIADLLGGGNNAGSVRAITMREVRRLVENGAETAGKRQKKHGKKT